MEHPSDGGSKLPRAGENIPPVRKKSKKNENSQKAVIAPRLASLPISSTTGFALGSFAVSCLAYSPHTYLLAAVRSTFDSSPGGAEEGDELVEIRRQGGFEGDAVELEGVDELEAEGVEGLASNEG
jgi:hypothetical protein